MAHGGRPPRPGKSGAPFTCNTPNDFMFCTCSAHWDEPGLKRVMRISPRSRSDSQSAAQVRLEFHMLNMPFGLSFHTHACSE